MRVYVTIFLLTFIQASSATECEPVLKRFVSILTDKGELAAGNNSYIEKFSASEFSGACKVTHGKMVYTLYLHPDNVSIVLSSVVAKSGIVKFHGPFYSAYKK